MIVDLYTIYTFIHLYYVVVVVAVAVVVVVGSSGISSSSSTTHCTAYIVYYTIKQRIASGK